MTETELRNLLPSCCRIGFAPIEEYEGQEKERILTALPATRTVVVITHHVQDSMEWTWLKFPAARNGETSPADIHTLAITERVMNRLMAMRIVPARLSGRNTTPRDRGAFQVNKISNCF